MSTPTLVTFTIPSIETYINKQGIEKKKPIGMPKDWVNKITEDNYKSFNNKNHEVRCLLTGYKSKITVIDFDNKKSYEKICKDFPEIKKYKTIKTRRGFHIYCIYNSNILTTTDGLLNYNNVDIANDKHMVFCPPTFYYDISGNIVEYEDLGGDILEVPSIIINDLKQNQIKEVEPSLPIAIPVNEQIHNETFGQAADEESSKNYNIIKTCLDNGLLNQRAFMDYDAWMKVGFAIRHSTKKTKKGYELWLQFSKINEEKFEEKETKHLWNKSKDKFDNPITIGSLIKWAKDCNLELYNSLFCPKKDNYYISLEDLQDIYNIGDIITKTLNTTLIFCQEKWYMLNSNNLWKQQKEPSYYITREIRKYIDFSHKQIVIRIE